MITPDAPRPEDIVEKWLAESCECEDLARRAMVAAYKDITVSCPTCWGVDCGACFLAKKRIAHLEAAIRARGEK